MISDAMLFVLLMTGLYSAGLVQWVCARRADDRHVGGVLVVVGLGLLLSYTYLVGEFAVMDAIHQHQRSQWNEHAWQT
jgi:hypothetical protein